MNKTFFLPLILLFFVFYFLVFPVSSGNEVFWKASKLYDYRNINSSVSINLDEPLILDQGQYRGVLKSGIGHSFLETDTPATAYTDSYLFRKSGHSLIIENLISHEAQTIPMKGVPLTMGDHIYSVDFGSAYIEEIDRGGRSLWRWQGISPITALATGKGVTVFGSIDGRVRIFSASGIMTELNVQDASTDQVIYGLALSGDTRILAVVSGLNDQVVRQFRLIGDGPPELIFEYPLKDRFREPVKMLFSRDGSYLWVEQEKSIYQFFSGKVNQELYFEGSFLTHRLDEEEGVYYILSRLYSNTEAQYQLTAYTLNGLILMQNQFEEYPEFFQCSGDQVFLSIDENMVVLSRVES